MIPRSGGGLSCWWPTPAQPGDWFSDEELRRSAKVHRPIHRITALVAAGQITLLIWSALALGTADASIGWVADAGRTGRATMAAAVVLLALQLPTMLGQRAVRSLSQVEAVAPTEAGQPRSAGLRFAARVVAWSTSACLTLVLLSVIALGLAPLGDRRLAPLIVAAVVGTYVLFRLVSSSVRSRGVAEATVPSTWAELAERAGVDQPMGYGLLGSPGPSDPASQMVNACVDGLGRSSRILVSRAVLTATPSIGRFVVAHEMTHLRRRHLEARLLAESGALALTLTATSLLVHRGWPWSVLGWSPDDPLSLPVAVLVFGLGLTLVRLPLAWLGRGLERSADVGAAELAAIPPADAIRSLALQAELAPPWPVRLFSDHPPPAERLAFVTRIRSQTVGLDGLSAPQSV